MNNRVCRLGGIITVFFLIFTMSETVHATDSGIEGTISVSPARPGPTRVGEPDKNPVANTTFVVKQGDERVTSFTTDAAGHFRVTLPPGHYVVSKEGPTSSIGHWQFEVEVASGKMASVDWTGDSGMR
jgi:hypothetical protein